MCSDGFQELLEVCCPIIINAWIGWVADQLENVVTPLDEFVTVAAISDIYLHCLQHSLFEHLFNLYILYEASLFQRTLYLQTYFISKPSQNYMKKRDNDNCGYFLLWEHLN